MKKLFQQIQSVFKHNETLEQEQITINSLMNLIFKEENTTDNSIKLFQKFKNKFEQEIAKRGIDSLMEHTACEDYFTNSNKDNLTKQTR